MSRSQPVLPYRVLPPDAVVPSSDGWSLVVDGKVVTHLSDGDPFPAWDARLSFQLERHLRIDDDIAHRLQLGASGSCCEAIVSVSTGSGLSRTILFREPIAAGRLADVHIVITPPSERLANELVLTTGVYLARDLNPRDPLAPRVRGSRLWEMMERLRLEGGAARLPMYEVPFSVAFAGDGIEHADYHVEIAEEPDVEVESALTVYVNSERPAFAAALCVQDSAEERQLWHGVFRRVLLSTILSDGLLTASASGGETLASTVQRWARMVWPGIPLEKLGETSAASLSKREAQIDSWLNVVEPRVKEESHR